MMFGFWRNGSHRGWAGLGGWFWALGTGAVSVGSLLAGPGARAIAPPLITPPLIAPSLITPPLIAPPLITPPLITPPSNPPPSNTPFPQTPVSPALVSPALVSPALVSPALVSPALVSPALVSPALVSPALVSPALMAQRVPTPLQDPNSIPPQIQAEQQQRDLDPRPKGKQDPHHSQSSWPDFPPDLPQTTRPHPQQLVPSRAETIAPTGSAADLVRSRPLPADPVQLTLRQSPPFPEELGTLADLALPLPTDHPTAHLIPSPTQNIPNPNPNQLPSPDQLLPAPVPNPELDPNTELPDRITVSQFEVLGSSVFSAEELKQVLADLTNRPISFAELLEARSRITQYYVDRGYTTSGAYLPVQTLGEDNRVKIQVVEGSLEAIEVRGNHRLQESYVRDRLAIATAPPLNVNKLLEALQLLQLDPLIATISAELSAGIRPGQNLLQVEITEADSFSIGLGLDNGRSPSVGSGRREVVIREGNLFGWGDEALVAYTNTDGSDDVDISYTVPVNPQNGTLGLLLSFTRSEIIEAPFDPLDIIADSSQYELTYRQPIIRKPNQELALGITASHQRSQTSLLGVDFPLSPGANDDGETKITALRLFQEWTQRDAQQVFAVRSQFSLGLNLFDATAQDDGPDGQFLAWRGQAQWVRLLAPDWLFLARTDVQLTNDVLLPLEQFSAGGFDSVRGYRQDRLLTDNGVFASAEFRIPVMRVPEIEGLLQVTPFLDFGTGWNHEGPDPELSTLWGLGLGLRWEMGNNFTARLEYGIPLTEENDRDGDTLQEKGWYFSVRWTPF